MGAYLTSQTGRKMTLTAETVKRARARKKSYKLFDEKSLYLLVSNTGSRYWRMKYRIAGKENTCAFGAYPQVSLKNARTARDAARQQLSQGLDPNQEKQRLKEQARVAQRNAFKLVANDWFDAQSRRWKPATIKKKRWFLDKFLIPKLGSRPIADITPPQVLRMLRGIESNGTLENVKRTKQIASQVFRYGVASGLCDKDPTRDIADALITKTTKHHAALTNPNDVGRLISDIEAYDGTLVVKLLMKMSYLTIQRPGEVRQMLWQEINFESKQWELAEKQKMNIPQIIPLSTQAMSVLKELRPHTGHSRYVFLGQSSALKPMSDATVTKALRKMGYTSDQMTAHGFRAMGRTLLDEVLEFEPHLIEQQISHTVKDPLGRAYNRTKHLPQRRKMMQRWADYLDALSLDSQNKNVLAGNFHA